MRGAAGLGQGAHCPPGAGGPPPPRRHHPEPKEAWPRAGACFSVLGGLNGIQHSPQMGRPWPTELSNVYAFAQLNERPIVMLIAEALGGSHWWL